MKIGELRVRVMIQKNETRTDKYGNHKSVWTDYFPCWATAVTGLHAEEQEEAGVTHEADKLDVTVRWCSEVDAVNSKEYRLLIRGRIYNISNIDDMGFKHNSRKFHAELVER